LLALHDHLAQPATARLAVALELLGSDRSLLHVVWGDQTSDGRRFLISELLEGETLERYARGDEVLPDDAVAQVGIELLDALIAIHPDTQRIGELGQSDPLTEEEWAELQRLREHGFVHRDIKPANLMLTPTGLKIVDFNIASRVGDPVFTTSGTPQYMPPDVDLTEWSPSADLYAAGIVLYELTCRVHPYADSETAARARPVDPRVHREDLREEIALTLLRACAPSSQERFATAREMKESWEESTVSLFRARDDFAPGVAPMDKHASKSRGREHETNEGACDVVQVHEDELRGVSNVGAGWPAVLSCNRDGGVWPAFCERATPAEVV